MRMEWNKIKYRAKVILIALIVLFIVSQLGGFFYYYFQFDVPTFKDSVSNIEWVEGDGIALIRSEKGELATLIQIAPGEFNEGAELEINQLKGLLGPGADFLDQEFPSIKRKIESGYWLADSETSFKFFEHFVKSTGYETVAEKQGYSWLLRADEFVRTNGVNWRNYSDSIKSNQPVVMIAWADAKAFTNWLSSVLNKEVRLPESSEWEYACKAGTPTLFSFGNDTTFLSDFAWYNRNLLDKGVPQTIKHKRPNSWGLYDMHGNVWEWCENSPNFLEIKSKAIRGGSWLNSPRSLRSSFNAFERSEIREPHIGFRILVELN